MSQELLKAGKKQNHNKSGAAKRKTEKRKEEAQARQEAYNKLTPEQKLAKLDAGGFRAEKQRAQLVLELAQITGD